MAAGASQLDVASIIGIGKRTSPYSSQIDSQYSKYEQSAHNTSLGSSIYFDGPSSSRANLSSGGRYSGTSGVSEGTVYDFSMNANSSFRSPINSISGSSLVSPPSAGRGGWKNSPIDYFESKTSTQSATRQCKDALEALGIAYIDDDPVKRLKVLLASHMKETINKFDSVVNEILKKLKPVIKEDLTSVVADLLYLNVNGIEVEDARGAHHLHDHHHTTMTLNSLLEHLHNKDAQLILNPPGSSALNMFSFAAPPITATVNQRDLIGK